MIPISSGRLIRSATAAYRADVATRATPLGANDSAWLALANLLEHAALIQKPERERLLDEAIAMSIGLCAPGIISRFALRVWGGGTVYRAIPLLVVAEDMLQAGAGNLARTMLDSLLVADESLTALERGRLLARRARIDSIAGNLDEARAGYHAVLRLAPQTEGVELRARALVGRVAIAQMTGNYPQMRALARRAVGLATQSGPDRLRREAHNGVMIAATICRSYDEALAHGWAVYELSAGDPVEEVETLQNLGQVLLLAGHSKPASAAFAAVLARGLPARIAMPALGGLALASAAIGAIERVRWATSEVKRAARSQVPRWAVASALMECATACATIHDRANAEVCRDLAAKIAAAHEFHEIEFRAAELAIESEQPMPVVPHPFAVDAARIVEEVQWLEPKRLPKHLDLEAALG